jgi:uncharacterized protein
MRMFDANVLVHGFRPDAERHEEFRTWLELQGRRARGVRCFRAGAQWVRAGSHASIDLRSAKRPSRLPFRGPADSRSSELCRASARWRHWGIFSDLCLATGSVGNAVADGYLAALAIEHGCEFMTADKAFGRFPGLRWRHPLDRR